MKTCVVTFGAAIDGKWTVETQGRNGSQTQTLTLKADGSRLTGSLDGGQGGPAEIKEGKIDGMNVSFKVSRAGRGDAEQIIQLRRHGDGRRSEVDTRWGGGRQRRTTGTGVQAREVGVPRPINSLAAHIKNRQPCTHTQGLICSKELSSRV
jgi:hypothetical protein